MEIREHAFNSEWLGLRFGISEDPSLLSADDVSFSAAVAGFDLVEIRSPGGRPMPTRHDVHFVDTQIQYRLLVRHHKPHNDTKVLPVQRILPDQWADFASERYAALGLGDETIRSRYSVWAQKLVERSPDFCGEVTHGGRTVGWFFAEPDPVRHYVHFALAVQSRGAINSGLLIYEAAAQHFRAAGFSSVRASFSARNVAALNVHVALGCRFTGSVDHFLWQRRACEL